MSATGDNVTTCQLRQFGFGDMIGHARLPERTLLGSEVGRGDKCGTRVLKMRSRERQSSSRSEPCSASQGNYLGRDIDVRRPFIEVAIDSPPQDCCFCEQVRSRRA
jgi:hypothetical protein